MISIYHSLPTILYLYNHYNIIFEFFQCFTLIGAWSVQLSAYKSGFESHYSNEKIVDIYVLQIFKDETYKLYKLKDNFLVFLSCLEIYRFEV